MMIGHLVWKMKMRLQKTEPGCCGSSEMGIVALMRS